MMTRDLRVFNVTYSFQWRQRIEDDNGDFESWGPFVRETKQVIVVAPSEYYVRAWVETSYAYDTNTLPKIEAITSVPLAALINPNLP